MIQVLQHLHDSEINFEISAFFDGEFTVRLGDNLNGYTFEKTLSNIEEAILTLKLEAIKQYPNSEFSKRY